ncbi:MAG: hypothetical protein A2428_01860 [Bdellovibrionales bacterium RIFOXYC1_FULL_54_43]|nr:MAG: hypothetical protein A2428_01860 [Bdellovibrionales bacterium RIFOXYC1_FULL_54_43]OFZ81685.1 MAG: hypothetical protein A2603_12070 [Bdellovibrionales bacterium RIFOXYD1_FULL_55_31]
MNSTPLADPESAGTLHFICKKGSSLWGIPIEQILEVTALKSINPFPSLKSEVVGMINFRGDPLPILNCADFDAPAESGSPQANAGGGSTIIISGAAGSPFGIIVESVQAITRIEAGQLTKLDLAKARPDTWIAGTAYHDGKIVFVLNLGTADSLFQS